MRPMEFWLLGVCAGLATSCATGGDGGPGAAADPSCNDAKCDLFGSGMEEADAVEAWPTGDPVAHGFDPEALDLVDRDVADHDGRCLLVVRDGVLVHESYFHGADAATLHDVFSMAKTFTSALVGIALGRGEIGSLDQPVADQLAAWRGDPDHAGVTVRDLLSGVSGLAYRPTLGLPIDVGDFSWLFLTPSLDDEATSWPQGAAPGTEWRYNNHAVQVLGALLAEATGESPEAYAREHLWGPAGLSVSPLARRQHGTYWRLDAVGDPVMFSSVHATCRGLARFGQLLLDDGARDGVQIIPADYVRAMRTPSQALNQAYGLLTWVNQGPPAEGNTHNDFAGPPFPLAPADLFSAEGVGQNFIDVLPSQHMVIVHVRPPDLVNVFALLADGRQDLHREVQGSVLAALLP